MKISTIIKRLKELRKVCGDCEVVLDINGKVPLIDLTNTHNYDTEKEKFLPSFITAHFQGINEIRKTITLK